MLHSLRIAGTTAFGAIVGAVIHPAVREHVRDQLWEPEPAISLAVLFALTVLGVLFAALFVRNGKAREAEARALDLHFHVEGRQIADRARQYFAGKRLDGGLGTSDDCPLISRL